MSAVVALVSVPVRSSVLSFIVGGTITAIHKGAGRLRVGGQRAKTNLELETRELLRTFRLRGEQWNGPIQDLGLTAAGESHARPSNAEYPPRRTSGSNRSPAVATDATDSWSQKTEVREGGDTFVIIDIHDNTIVPDLILPASPASSSRTAASSVSTVRTKVFAAYHPILNSEPWETVANEATVSMTRLQAASQACGAGTSTQEGIQSLAPDVTEQTRRSEVRSLSNTDETTSHRRRCCSVGFWRASSGPRPRGDEPPAAVDVCSTEGRQQQHSDATHCQSNSSVPQANRLEQGYEGLGSEQHQSIIAQERVPTVESDATVSPGAAEDTRAVLLEVREAQTALHDSHTLDADSRTGWNAIQSVIAIFLCRAEVPPIEPRSHGQDELRSNPTATVSAIGSDCPTWSTSIIAASAESSEDSSSILTSSSSRIIFGRILLGLEELITMLSQLVKPDSRSRDTQVV
ncbi:unnamed protein product [Mortierella alpina]